MLHLWSHCYQSSGSAKRCERGLTCRTQQRTGKWAKYLKAEAKRRRRRDHGSGDSHILLNQAGRRRWTGCCTGMAMTMTDTPRHLPGRLPQIQCIKLLRRRRGRIVLDMPASEAE